ncbi:MAG: DUF4332 domain-containing protein [Gemmatimonadaceae bacterium]|jgi:predicted flap endonuclease-1-like 5' DNA nuclease|nr:DUF4332 domain-containing protein [Gemmatimonadaceae bacterium]
MTYKIERIEGIGPHFAERLATAGIRTSDDLLSRCASDEGRRMMEMRTGISAGQLTTWMHQADLMRVNGIGSEFSQLLEASGIETVRELGERKPENVVHLLDRVNDEKHLTRVVPPLKTVSKWVERARRMEMKPEPQAEARPAMTPVFMH